MLLSDKKTKHFKIVYPSGANVDLGNELTPTHVKDKPRVVWSAVDGDLYALLMTDPDAPSRDDPKFREFRHWAVINIPGSNVASGREVFEYIGSGPPMGTGLHRYIFLLYKQNGPIVYDDSVVTNRYGTRFSHFASK